MDFGLNSKEKDLYEKYMAFHNVMLEEYNPLEIAAILASQGLSFYKTFLSPEDYDKMVNYLSNHRDEIKTLQL